MKTNYINKKNPVRKGEIYETRHISTSFTLLNLLNLNLNSLNLKDRKVWKLYRKIQLQQLQFTSIVKRNISMKKLILLEGNSFLQISTLNLLQIIPIHDMDNSLSQILLKKTSTHFIKIQLLK